MIRRTGVQEYVWNSQERAWELEPASGIEWSDWAQAPADVWDDETWFEECAPAQPEPVTVKDQKDGCDLSTYGDFEAGVIRRTGVQEYVWNSQERAWELEPASGIEWAAWTQADADVYDDAQYFEHCAPQQPEPKPLHQEQSGCDLSEYGDFEPGLIERDGLQAYVWNAQTRAWELGQVAWGAWEQSSSYSDEEYQELCAPEQPQPEPLSETVPGCDLAQYGDFEPGVIGRTGEQPYVWDLDDREWVLGDEQWGPWTQTSTYSDEEYQELCAPEQPQPEPLSETVPGCDLAQYGDFEPGVIGRTGEQPYVWDLDDREWVLGEVAWGPWTQTSTYTDDEYYELCAEEQPEPVVREVAGTQASCKLGGVSTWVDTYTTPFVWNAETRTWELGEETGPVRTDEEFVKYTSEQYDEKCAEVKGEEGKDDDEEKPGIEVKGEQGQAPGQVPTEVAAGENGAAGPLGMVQRNPLWLLAVGGGATLMGLAGARRRRTANR